MEPIDLEDFIEGWFPNLGVGENGSRGRF